MVSYRCSEKILNIIPRSHPRSSIYISSLYSGCIHPFTLMLAVAAILNTILSLYPPTTMLHYHFLKQPRTPSFRVKLYYVCMCMSSLSINGTTRCYTHDIGRLHLGSNCIMSVCACLPQVSMVPLGVTHVTQDAFIQGKLVYLVY